jgi:HlyD family secretion protein
MNILERPSSNGHSTGRIETILIDARRWSKRPWRAIVAAILALAIIITGALIYRARSSNAVAYVTAPVAQQDLVQTVSATGTVNPQNTINVGTQVSGIVSEIDVDYNSVVKKGQVLARLDPTTLQAQLASAQAQLAQSQAQAAADQNGATGAAATARVDQANAQSSEQAIASADSNITKAQSALAVAQLTVNRDNGLLAQGYIAQATVDSDKSNLVAAQSALQASQTSAEQARSQAAASAAQVQAGIAQSAQQSDTANAGGAAIGIQEASVQQAQTNLSNSVIKSPVDGTVIARDVSVGTTVAASLQTPTLFAIAQNLSKMEVDLAVGEPDIGSVKDGESVNFTVLAYPNRTFHGIVSQVRKNPVVTQNVVTYTTVVLVNNNDQALLPGMTANATIGVQTASNALVVPLSALSFQPAFNGSGGHHRPAGATGTPRATSPAGNGAAPWGSTLGSSSAAIVSGSQGRLFVERSGKLVRVPVTITLVSGTQAAVAPAGDATLAAGDQVVTGGGAAAPARAPRSQAPANPLTGGGGGGAMRGIH